MLIYGLIDPRSNMIRYVGLTTRWPHRPLMHLKRISKVKTHKENWIQELLRLGLSYEVCVLEKHDDLKELKAAEIWWIAYGRCLGWPLTNLTSGGDGLLNPSEEVRRKISEANTGNTYALGHSQPWTEQRRDHQRLLMLGNAYRPIGGNQHLVSDITGVRFGSLIAISRVKVGSRKWLFRCDCGKLKEINGTNVRIGRTRSCGCLERIAR